MSDIYIEKLNEVYLRISGEYSILRELSGYFTFEVPGARFTPAYKNKLWDGYIKLLNLNTRCIYGGLYQHILEFADKSGYSVSVAEDVFAPADTDRSIIEKYINEVLKLYAFDSKIEIRDYQVDAIKHIIDHKRATIESPTSCHKKGDKVLMASGLFKNIEDIVVGEYVIGNDGKHKKVLRVFSGENVELYDIIPKNSKNTKITVTGEHILPLKFSDYSAPHGYAKGNKDHIEYITVNEYLKKSNYYKHCANMFYNSNVLHFDNEKNPNINLSPYFIGCYIGDGSSYSCEITSIDKEIIDEIYSQAAKLSCTIKPPSQWRKYSYKILGSRNKKNIIFGEFEKVGLYFSGKNRLNCEDRFIPFELINSSEDFRLELLAGLIDTDGYYSKNVNYEYSSKSLRLCQDIQLLAISLGFKTTVSSKLNKKHDKFYHTTRISGDLSKIPVRLPRKKHIEQIREVYRSTYNKKFDINFHGIDDFYGIEVEDHLYITNDGLITHNSGKSLVIYASLRYLIATKQVRRVLLVFPTTGLVSQMKADFIDYSTVNGWDVESRSHMIYSGQEKETDKQIVFSTYQSLAKMPISYYNQYDAIFVDECYSPDTEILTDRGFIRFDELPKDCLVAQYDEGIISFVTPMAHIVKAVDDDLIHIHNSNVDILVTKKHDILTQKLCGKSRDIPKDIKIHAEDFKTGAVIRMYGGGFGSGMSTTLTPDEKLLISLQADGCIVGKPNGQKRLQFQFSKENKIIEFLKLMELGGFSFVETKSVQKKNNTRLKRRFSVHGTPYEHKNIQEYFNISDFSVEKAKEIIEYMIKWDGHITKNGLYYYSNTDEAAVDFYQSVAILAGYRARKTIQIDNRSEKYNNIHRLFIQKTNIIGTQGMLIDKVAYTGLVYCVSVPSQNIIVRRNGFVVVCGNCHTAKSKSITDIMERAHGVAYRVGFTGSLQDGKCHRLVIEGLFGKAFKTTTTKELINNNQAAQLKIHCILLKYNRDICKPMKKASYAEEIEYLTMSTRRNAFIAGLANSLSGNTLILFQFVEKQGKPLYELLKGNGNCHFIHGKVSVDDRDAVRRIAESTDDCTIVASYGTFSTGTSIKRIDNIIFASPYKSKIKVLQSVGRGLRIGNGKSKCNLYDIADDFSYKSHKNFTLQHFEARVGYYAADKFDYSIIEYQLEK